MFYEKKLLLAAYFLDLRPDRMIQNQCYLNINKWSYLHLYDPHLQE